MNYRHLIDIESARRSIKDLHTLCLQLFGHRDTLVNELIRHSEALLLGITKAPQHNQWGDEVTPELVKRRLQAGGDTTGIVEVLAPRLFLFNPLGTASTHPAFLTPTQCRERIQDLNVMPSRCVSYVNPETLTKASGESPCYFLHEKEKFKEREVLEGQLEQIARELSEYNGE